VNRPDARPNRHFHTTQPTTVLRLRRTHDRSTKQATAMLKDHDLQLRTEPQTALAKDVCSMQDASEGAEDSDLTSGW
jgi:hypothetical protein